jgi:NitT/TauT family transport system substrate-binding protein
MTRPAWLFMLALMAVPSSAWADGTTAAVRVLVPDRDNLQYLAFWVAEGAGYLRAEGIELTLYVPSAPSQTVEWVKRGDADVAVLPPPMYLELIADRVPIVLEANLLQNDPIDLVLRKSVMLARGISRDQPVAERLQRMHGLRIGVAPNPPPRLRALFSAFGLDADRDIQMVTLRGPEQNYAFEKDEVDGLYAHTPYLEAALVDQGAEMVVDQSAGEVPALAARQIHALVAMRRFANEHPATVSAMVRAIGQAEELVHRDRAAAVAAVRSVFPSMDPRKVESIVAIYEPAIPVTPTVTVEGLEPALAFFPETKRRPSLEGIDLRQYVADGSHAAPVSGYPQRSGRWALAVAIALATAISIAIWAARQRVS